MFSKKVHIPQVVKQNFLFDLSLNYEKNQIEIFRIGISAYSILSILTLLADYKVLLAPDGLIAWEVTNANSFWFEPHPLKIANFLHLDPGVLFFVLISIYLLVLSLLLVGIWTKGAAITALVCQASFTTILSPYAFGVDIYQTVCLFFLCIFPTGYSLSLIKKREAPRLKEVRQVSIRLLQIYLSLTYLSAGVEKAVMPNWWNGKFIYFLFNDPTVITSSTP